MRHSMTHRLVATLSGIWLTLLLAEPAALHICAVHSDGMGHAMVPSTHHAESAPQGAENPGHRHSAQCSCLGASVHSAPVDLPAAPVLAVETTLVLTPVVIPIGPDEAATAAPDFLLPYPNGPPVTNAA
jgi:hypothetical protein